MSDDGSPHKKAKHHHDSDNDNQDDNGDDDDDEDDGDEEEFASNANEPQAICTGCNESYPKSDLKACMCRDEDGNRNGVELCDDCIEGGKLASYCDECEGMNLICTHPQGCMPTTSSSQQTIKGVKCGSGLEQNLGLGCGTMRCIHCNDEYFILSCSLCSKVYLCSDCCDAEKLREKGLNYCTMDCPPTESLQCDKCSKKCPDCNQPYCEKCFGPNTIYKGKCQECYEE